MMRENRRSGGQRLALAPETQPTHEETRYVTVNKHIKILSQESNRGEIERIGADEWLTLYSFNENETSSTASNLKPADGQLVDLLRLRLIGTGHDGMTALTTDRHQEGA